MPQEQNSIRVSGFSYEDPLLGENAKKEQEAVSYIKSQMNLNDGQQVYKLYVQIITSEMFHTEVGIQFLTELRYRLLEMKEIDPYQIPDIPIKKKAEVVTEQEIEENHLSDAVREHEDKRLIEGLRRRNKKLNQTILIMRVVIGIFVFLIIGMFLIQLTSSTPTVLNYRTKIQNEYSEWEQELLDKEEELRQRERNLD